MGLIPQPKLGKVEFFEAHVTPWTTNAVAIGTTTTAMTDLSTKTTAARTAYAAQQAAQEAAKAATLNFTNAVDAMMTAGSAIIKNIRSKAETTGNSVYVLAQIPAPATPAPVGPPGTPTDFAVELNQDGSLVLKWKCINPSGAQGTMYQVWRRDTAVGEFQYVGGTGEKKFLDMTIPSGSSQVTYQIQAVRSTQSGPWSQFNVNFGVEGEATVTVQAPQALLAA